MFERYTEGARRTVFFARYEANSLGSPDIDTEHLLLGILREDKWLIRQVLLNVDYESAHRDIAARTKTPEAKVNTRVDLPLTEHSKLVFKYAMEEADRLNLRHIGTEELLLGLLRDKEFQSAKLLTQFGASLESLRKRVEALLDRTKLCDFVRQYRRVPVPPPNIVEIHGGKRNLEEIRNIVTRLKSQPWLWERKLWQARDVVYERNGKRFSFDASLAQDESKLILVKGGWKKDYCTIWQWELFETDDSAHGTGYTNGKDWVCEECHQRFIAGEYFGSAYTDIT